MTDAKTIRDYIKIVEGELIPQSQFALRLKKPDPYGWNRAILHLASAANFTTSNQYGSQAAILFANRETYDEAKRTLEQSGVEFEEEPAAMSTTWDQENAPQTENKMSPYPSNKHVQDHGSPPLQQRDFSRFDKRGRDPKLAKPNNGDQKENPSKGQVEKSRRLGLT